MTQCRIISYSGRRGVFRGVYKSLCVYTVLPVVDENPMNFLWTICKTIIIKATFAVHDVTKITTTKQAYRYKNAQ